MVEIVQDETGSPGRAQCHDLVHDLHGAETAFGGGHSDPGPDPVTRSGEGHLVPRQRHERIEVHRVVHRAHEIHVAFPEPQSPVLTHAPGTLGILAVHGGRHGDTAFALVGDGSHVPHETRDHRRAPVPVLGTQGTPHRVLGPPLDGAVPGLLEASPAFGAVAGTHVPVPDVVQVDPVHGIPEQQVADRVFLVPQVFVPRRAQPVHGLPAAGYLQASLPQKTRLRVGARPVQVPARPPRVDLDPVVRGRPQSLRELVPVRLQHGRPLPCPSFVVRHARPRDIQEQVGHAMPGEECAGPRPVPGKQAGPGLFPHAPAFPGAGPLGCAVGFEEKSPDLAAALDGLGVLARGPLFPGVPVAGAGPCHR